MLVIDSFARMHGQILAAGRLQLDGWFQGDLICSDLVIGPDGYLLGSVSARTLSIDGQLVGRAHVGTARLNAGSLFEGTLYHTQLYKSADATLVGDAISTRGALTLPADLITLEKSSTTLGGLEKVASPSLSGLQVT